MLTDVRLDNALVGGLKVLVVTPHVFEGGAEKAVLNLVYQLNLLGCDACIAALSADLSRVSPRFAQLKFILPEKQLVPAVLNRFSSVVKCSLRELFSLRRLLDGYVDLFDVVCVCNFPSYWASYFVDVNRPVIWFSSEVLLPINQTRDLYDKSVVFRFALRLAQLFDRHIVNSRVDAVVTCSALNGKLIKARYGRKALVLRTGVDYDFFNEKVVDAKAQLGLGEGPLLLQVGALVQRKNQLFSLHVLKEVKRVFGSARLVLVGEGSWQKVLEREAEVLGLEEDVVFLGAVSEDTLRVVYQACDINLFPVVDQTWGLVPFEALAAGTCSVVARGAGAAEVIGREAIGFVSALNVDCFSQAILYALRNPKLTADMIRRGQTYVQTYLTWQRYALDVFTALNSIAGLKQSGLEPLSQESLPPITVQPSLERTVFS